MPYLVLPVVPAGRMRDRGQPVLRGPGGLVLRPWEAGDAPVVLEAYQDPAIQQWNLRTFGSLDEAGAWIAHGRGSGWPSATAAGRSPTAPGRCSAGSRSGGSG